MIRKSVGFGRLLRLAGSLRLGAVLIVLLLVALAVATVVESLRGTEHALVTFYRSAWFLILLALMGVNILAALVMRFPFPRAKIGFFLTHASVLLIFAGAMATRHWGVDGQVALFEGESADSFRASSENVIVMDSTTGAQAAAPLDGADFRTLRPADNPRHAAARLGDVTVEVMRYLPDSDASTEVANDAADPITAVEVSLSATGADEPQWVFDGETVEIGRSDLIGLNVRGGGGPRADGRGSEKASADAREQVNRGANSIALTVLANRQELESRLAEPAAGNSLGILSVEFNETKYEIRLEDCTHRAAALGDSAYTVQVVEYFAHATVGKDNKITSLSAKPVNPAVRVEIAGPEGKHTQLAFAKFPEFRSMHGGPASPDVAVTFVATDDAASPTADVEVLTAPGEGLYVRMGEANERAAARELSVGDAIETPWPGRYFTVQRRFDRARRHEVLVPIEPARADRQPAILVKVAGADQAEALWLHKYRPRGLVTGGRPYEIAYTDQTHALGFDVTLNKFTVAYYAGGRQPRSFESRITISDAATGRTESRIVSMNRPTSFGGYTFYQSSYQLAGGKAMSVLSVARDPGKPIVFAGYIAIMAGMLWVLGVRMKERRRSSVSQTQALTARIRGTQIDLRAARQPCTQGAADSVRHNHKPQPADRRTPRRADRSRQQVPK